MRVFYFKFFWFIGLLVVVSIGLTITSSKDLVTDIYPRKISEYLVKGENVIFYDEFVDDRRLVDLVIFKNRNRRFNNLIIGSSRIMKFGSHTGFENSLNLGVSGATLEDLEIILNNVFKNNITYDRIIVDFNPWYLQDNVDTRFKNFYFYSRLLRTLKSILTFNHDFSEFIVSINLLFNSNSAFLVTSKIANYDHFIKFSDGSIFEKPLSPEKKEYFVQRFLKHYYLMSNFYKIDINRLNRFVKLLKLNNRVNVKVIVNITPFHPAFINRNRNDLRVKNILKSQILLKKLISDKIVVFGDFNPISINLNSSDFRDGFHLTEEGIIKIYSKKYLNE
jgi:hypothetical protein